MQHHPYQDDVDRIVRVYAERGIELDDSDAIQAWGEYSDQMSAGWMCLPEKDIDVFDAIITYLQRCE